MTNEKMIYYFRRWLRTEHNDLYDFYAKPSQTKIDIYKSIRSNYPSVKILSANSQKFTVGYIDIINGLFVVDTGYGYTYKRAIDELDKAIFGTTFG